MSISAWMRSRVEITNGTVLLIPKGIPLAWCEKTVIQKTSDPACCRSGRDFNTRQSRYGGFLDTEVFTRQFVATCLTESFDHPVCEHFSNSLSFAFRFRFLRNQALSFPVLGTSQMSSSSGPRFELVTVLRAVGMNQATYLVFANVVYANGVFESCPGM